LENFIFEFGAGYFVESLGSFFPIDFLNLYIIFKLIYLMVFGFLINSGFIGNKCIFNEGINPGEKK
jgi:hypothetical protein